MSDIRFGTKWAHADYGLIVAPYAIPMPEPQTNFVEIPGRDGALDLSEAFGTVRYADRVIPLTLYARAPFDVLIGEVRRYLPQLVGMQLVADTGATIGWLAPAMDDALGAIRRRKERLV